jgi:hypothetical protein
MPAPLNESFQLSEELFNRIEIRWVWRQIHQLHSSVITHLLDPLCVMEGRIIHNKNRLWLRPFTTQREQLLDEILEDGAICGSLKHACEDDAILCICWQYLISVLTLELGNLGWSHTKRRLTRPPKPNPLVAARLIHVHEVIRTESRQVMQVKVSQISIPPLCYPASCSFGPTNGRQRSSYAESCHKHLELVPKKDRHLVLIQVRLFQQVFTQSV